MRSLGGLAACSPRNFWILHTLDSDLIIGGGELKLEGENPTAPPPLYATLHNNIHLKPERG